MPKPILKFVRSAAGKLAEFGLDKLSPFLGEAILRNPLKLPESIIDKSLSLVSGSKEMLVPHAKNLSEKLYNMATERLKVSPAFGQMSMAFPGIQNTMNKPLPEPAYGPYFRPPPSVAQMKSTGSAVPPVHPGGVPNVPEAYNIDSGNQESMPSYKLLKEQEKQLSKQLKQIKSARKSSAKKRKIVKKVGLDSLEPAKPGKPKAKAKKVKK